MNIPNLITVARMILVPVVFWLLITQRNQTAFWTFMVAGASDAIDGYLAKRFGWTTELGAYLDPLADKVLIVCIFIALGVSGQMPSWLVIMVVARDVLIVSAVVLSWLLDNPVTIHPSALSKANTFVQILLAGIVLADAGFTLEIINVREVLTWVVAALTLSSLAAYLRIWMLHMSRAQNQNTPL